MIPPLPVPEARPACPRCRRPLRLCYCAHVAPQTTQTRVVVLQHPREARVALGTLRMVQLGLPAAEVRRGVDFNDEALVRELCAQRPQPYLLFPGAESQELSSLAGSGPHTLIVIDGTWPQAKQIVRRNLALAALPRVAFTPSAPSVYRIRPQPAAHCVSTLEAIAMALDVLEDGQGRFQEALLRPLLALVEAQLRFTAEEPSYRRRRPRQRPQRPTPPHSPRRLRELRGQIVCVQGEANAWPRAHPEHRPPELIQWRALRLATGEGFAATLRPEFPLGPCTASNLELPPDALAGGLSWGAFLAAWEDFLRPGDALALWGSFALGLARARGLPLPEAQVDLRQAARDALGQRPGGVERCVELLGGKPAPPEAPGRCARRLALTSAVARALSAPPGGAL